MVCFPRASRLLQGCFSNPLFLQRNNSVLTSSKSPISFVSSSIYPRIFPQSPFLASTPVLLRQSDIRPGQSCGPHASKWERRYRIATAIYNAAAQTKGTMRQARVREGHADISESDPVRQKELRRVVLIGVWSNVALCALKLAVGVVEQSEAVIADALHSISDLFSDFTTLFVLRVAALPASVDMPYGYQKAEALGSLLIAAILIATGVGIGVHAVALGQALLAMETGAAAASSLTSLSFVAILASIIVKEWLFRITAAAGKRLNSPVCVANAWHHRSDAISSVVALVGIAGALYGYPIMDPIGAAAVACLIIQAGASMVRDCVLTLTDATADPVLLRRLTHEVEHAVSDKLAAFRGVPTADHHSHDEHEHAHASTVAHESSGDSSASTKVAVRGRWCGTAFEFHIIVVAPGSLTHSQVSALRASIAAAVKSELADTVVRTVIDITSTVPVPRHEAGGGDVHSSLEPLSPMFDEMFRRDQDQSTVHHLPHAGPRTATPASALHSELAMCRDGHSVSYKPPLP